MNKFSLIKSIKHYLENASDNFSGFGLILVNNDINNLPVMSLLSSDGDYSSFLSVDDVVKFIFDISIFTDIRHDGFHIVSETHGLLKISQFFSPKIRKDIPNIKFNVGARLRAAQFGSLYKDISAIIIVSNKGEIIIAENGEIHRG